jgi:uncharacterized protein YlxW (UPF0749 family)
MSFYSGLADRALSLIKRRGTAITITRKNADYNPTTGANSNPPADLTGFGVFEQFDSNTLEDNIQRGDLRVICNALSSAPEEGDQINGYQIVNVTEIKPDNSTVVIYELQVRN